jgi:hypothetical protein
MNAGMFGRPLEGLGWPVGARTILTAPFFQRMTDESDSLMSKISSLKTSLQEGESGLRNAGGISS